MASAAILLPAHPPLSSPVVGHCTPSQPGCCRNTGSGKTAPARAGRTGCGTERRSWRRTLGFRPLSFGSVHVHSRSSLALVGGGQTNWASDVLDSYDLSHRRFDDGNVLLGCSAADTDAGDYLALVG